MDGITRREFLKTTSSLAAGLLLPPRPQFNSFGLGRVTVTSVNVRAEPHDQATLLTTMLRDELVTIQSRAIADEGPPHNPIWYRVPDGYVHSGHIQLVKWEPQTPRIDFPHGGALFEISVPFTRSYRQPDPTSDPLYRLYYQATAWVEAVERGSDGRLWYRLLDDLLKVNYYVRAEHLRRVEPEELTPLSPDVPPQDKRIEVSLPRQELMAFEGDRLIFRTSISSGVPDRQPPGSNGIPTDTPTGHFYVDKKMPLRHMGDGNLTANLEAYELPGVPWTSFFHETGVAFHGTYWHNDYGRQKSHGCVNMRPEEAKWLFRWTTPVIEPDTMLEWGYGTNVFVY
jgi:hypothetical protein